MPMHQDPLLVSFNCHNYYALVCRHSFDSTTLLTHWGRVTHICVGNLIIIGSDNGLSPGRRQAIIWTNAGILLIGPWGTNFSDILIGIRAFSFKKIHLKMSSAKWRPFCLGLNVLTRWLSTTAMAIGALCHTTWGSIDIILFHRDSPVSLTGFTLILAWISNHIPSKLWDEIIYPFPNFSGTTAEFGKWYMTSSTFYNGWNYISIWDWRW